MLTIAFLPFYICYLSLVLTESKTVRYTKHTCTFAGFHIMARKHNVAKLSLFIDNIPSNWVLILIIISDSPIPTGPKRLSIFRIESDFWPDFYAPTQVYVLSSTVWNLKRRCNMPTYEFYCEKCEKSFSIVLSISEHEKKKYSCPKCKAKKLKQQVSSFQTVTSKKS